MILKGTYMMKPKIDMKIIVKSFDAYLASQKRNFEGVAVGAAALQLLGIITRLTQDCDLLDPKMPDWLKEAAIAFAKEEQKQGRQLAEDWLNNGPASLKKTLPFEWQARLVDLYNGKALKLTSLGRSDLLKTKLYAYCDRQVDLLDCIALKPSNNELDECYQWVSEQDMNPSWPEHVESMFNKLRKNLGYDTRS